MDEVVPAGLGGSLSGMELREQLGPEPLQGESLLAQALDDPQYRFSLGMGRGVTRVHEFHVPFHVGYGLTDRLTLRAMVPIVRRRIESAFGVDPTGATEGFTPVLTDVAGVEAFLDAFQSGLDETRAQVDQTCAATGEGSGACQDGRAFVTETEALFDAMSGAYATSPAFPLPQSDAGAALLARIEEVQAGMSRFGVESFEAPPPLATGFMDAAGFEGLFLAPDFGQRRGALTGTTLELWELGDIELSAAFRLLDLETGSEEGAIPRLRYRHSVGVAFRLGTSPADTLAHLLGPRSQRGRSDLELQHLNDLVLAGRLGVRVDLRYGIPLSEELERFYTPRAALLDPESSPQPFLWSPAGYQSMEIVPRLLLTPELAFGFRYHFQMRGEERYEYVGDQTAPGDPTEGSVDSRLHRVGGSLVYSTLEAAREGRTSLPFEVRARYDVVVAGRGGVPRTRAFEGGVKFFLF